MTMTRREFLAKREIRKILSQEGYPTYSYLIQDFDINLTKDPDVIGYMIPGKGVIVLNDGLDLEQISVVVRHEILHEFFNHAKRFEDYVGKDIYDKRSPSMHNNMNIAGDFDISNRGYTERDKKNIRKIRLNGQVLSGLVTEDEHPDWVGLSVEEMYDRLQQQMKQEQKQMKQGLKGQGQGQGQGGQGQQGQGSQQGQQDVPGNQSSSGSASSSSSSSSTSNQKGSAGGSGKRQPQIGDRGNEAIQAAEEAARQANIYKEDSKQAAKSAGEAGEKDLENDNKDLAKEAAKTEKEAEELADDIEEDGLDQEKKDQIKRIQDHLNDIETQRKLLDETERAVFTSRQLEADKKRRREYEDNPAKRFLDSVQLFIKDEVAYERTSSWKRPNKRYPISTGIIQRGKARNYNVPVPLLAVYFDRSGSWDDEKIKVGQQAIASLNQFVKKGQLKIKIYYFGDDISSDPDDPSLGHSTSATQKILDHIQAIHANNVIIMTDSDMDHQGEFTRQVTVPGAVWFLFKGGRCNKIMQYLHGRKLNKVYDL